MTEPWVYFTEKQEDIDCAIFLKPDGLERVHVYLRCSASFGLGNFVRSKALSSETWMDKKID